MSEKNPGAKPGAGAKAIGEAFHNSEILHDPEVSEAVDLGANVVHLGKSKRPEKSKKSEDNGADGGSDSGKRPPRGRGGPPSDPDDGRVSIKREAHKFDKEIQTAIAALAVDPPELFAFGEKIVKPQIIELRTAKEKTHSPALKEASDLTVRAALAKRTKWFRFDRRTDDWLGITPPKEIAAQIVSAGSLAKLPTISGLVGAPCLRPDGTVLTRPGYDEKSGIFYLANDPLEIAPIAARPSRKEADEALEDLGSLLLGFPFVDPDIDRSVALSLLLTPTLRAAFDVVPLHAIKAPVPGSGKSLLCDLPSGIAFGEKVGVVAASPDFAEVEKAIVGSMLMSVPIISLDNWNFALESNFVAQAIERPVLRLRELGGSKTYKTVNSSSFLVNGNGLTIAGDILRRTIMCSLDPRCENAEFREFEFNPFDEILSNRARYVRACLVIGKFGLGAPPHGSPELASFELWDRCIRRALIALGCGDPCGSIVKLRGEAPDVRARALAISCLENIFGNTSFTSRQAVLVATEHAKDNIFPAAPGMTEAMQADLREALLGIAEANGMISPKRLGRWLTRNKDRIVNGLKIEELIGDLHKNVLKFRIVRG